MVFHETPDPISTGFFGSIAERVSLGMKRLAQTSRCMSTLIAAVPDCTASPQGRVPCPGHIHSSGALRALLELCPPIVQGRELGEVRLLPRGRSQ